MPFYSIRFLLPSKGVLFGADKGWCWIGSEFCFSRVYVNFYDECEVRTDDLLVGGPGADTIYGGCGGDTLDGAGGGGSSLSLASVCALIYVSLTYFDHGLC